MELRESEEFISDIAVDDAKRTLLATRYISFSLMYKVIFFNHVLNLHYILPYWIPVGNAFE